MVSIFLKFEVSSILILPDRSCILNVRITVEFVQHGTIRAP